MSPNDSSVRERRTVVAFQGERGAYSEMAAHSHFRGLGIELYPCRTFREVFEAILDERAAFGMLPIENSLAGSVHENYDLLLEYRDIRICGEEKLRIRHHLIGVPGANLAEIATVYSHPQGLAQCSEFLDSLAGVQRIPFYDTAGSVAHVAGKSDATAAAIASAEAARVYGMEVLREGVETNPKNFTRFFILCPVGRPEAEGADKTSIVFSVPDRPGALLTCLGILAGQGINMTKLESRPIHGKPWEYMFYADLAARQDDPGSMDRALAGLGEQAESVRILGRYRGAGSGLGSGPVTV